MSDYTPKVGDRVRVVIEGTVITTVADMGIFEVDCYRWFGGTNSFTSVERLPAPEPAWQPGDVVIDDNGVLYQRRAPRPDDDARWVWNIGGMHRRGVIETTPTRPLTHLVRDGKPVSA